MSTDQPHTPENRALARRYHFLGGPSERSNGGISYAGLRTELGDDNAGALVTRLGVLAKVHNLDQLGVPLHHAVDRILQTLTADERRSISQGGAIPSRVEAIIRAEGEAAKLQMAQLGKGPNGFIRDPANATGPTAFGHQPMGAFRNLPSQSAASPGAATSSSVTASGGSPAQIARWQLEGTPLSNMTGLNTGVYAQLRGEGYSQAQIGATAGDLSKIRNFSSADVSHYTPYFVETSKQFRGEAKSVIESNGTKHFHEKDNVTEANAQAELHGGGKIEHQQMNSLGQLVYDSGINRETLRRQPGEPARRKFLGDHMRQNFNGFELDEWQKLQKADPAKGEEYRDQHGVPRDGKRTGKDASIGDPASKSTPAEKVANSTSRWDALDEKATKAADNSKTDGSQSTPSHSEGQKEKTASNETDAKAKTNVPAAKGDKEKPPAPTKEASANTTKRSGPSAG